MIDAQLPALQVVIPLLAAPVAMLIPSRRAVRVLALAVAWSCCLIAVLLLQKVQTDGPIRYAFGGWAAPYGIEYSVDFANGLVLVLVSTVASVVLFFGPGSAGVQVPEHRLHLYYAMLLLCLTGLLGMTITGDLFNVFVFLEITSLASYSLVGLGSTRHALTAAFSYLVMGSVGGIFVLLGIGILYQLTGTLNMEDLASRLQPNDHQRAVVLAMGLMVTGLGIKLALYPLHQWLPRAYSAAPSAVSAFLAATATKVSFYLLVRLLLVVFGAAWVFQTVGLHRLLIPLSVLAMFAGSIAAIQQTELKRLLAYSSVAQIGYMTLGLSYGDVTGVSAGLVHMFNHALMKGGLFLVVACISYSLDSSEIRALSGLGRKQPWTMAAFVCGGLALIGVPGTAGFISKWYLVVGALDKGWPVIAVLVLLSSLLAVVYVWRVVEVMYFEEVDEQATRRPVPVLMIAPGWLLVGATVVFGIYTKPTVGVATAAAKHLLGVSE